VTPHLDLSDKDVSTGMPCYSIVGLGDIVLGELATVTILSFFVRDTSIL
jgi:hypothetical protein